MKKLLHTQRRGLALWLLTLMCLASVNVWGQETVYLEEDFSSANEGTNNNTSGPSNKSWKNDKFPITTNTYQAGGTVKLGTSSKTGSITTKTLDLSSNNGIFYVTFDVKGWTNVEGKITISLDGTKNETVEYSATINDAFETKTVEMSGGTSNSTITIATTSKRAFIDNVKIFARSSISENFHFSKDYAVIEITDENFAEKLPTLTNNFTDKNVTYSSSEQNVAEINNTTGEITIKSCGTTTITAELKSENATASYELTVNKTAATLEFEQPSYTVNFDEIITLKAVSNNPDAQITYSATEGDWYIDETSGEFLAGTTAGSVTITATLAESDKYTGATATCTVNIVDPNQQVYSDVITAEDLAATTTQYIDFSGVTKTSDAVYAGNSAKNNTGSIQLRSSNSNSGIVATTSGGRISQIIIIWDNSTANARQIDVYGNTNPYTSAAELYETSGNTNQGELIGSLAKGETTLTIEGNYPYVGIRSNDGALYIKDITFVWEKVSEPTTGSFSITDAGFATYYTNKAFVMPENVQGGIVTKANNETSQLTVSYNYQPGTVVPAKTPIVLKGEKGDYTVNYTTSEETAPAGNMLYGADNVDADGMTFVEGTNVKYYKLALGNDGKCGFYWGAADGAAFEYTANRAFLAIDITDASQAPEGFSLDGDGGTTGINGVMNGNDDSQKIYTVTGVYAGKSLDKLPKGIYIVGGKKVAVK
ncbi:hypothetical protein [Prevotella marseillensis]|uniref:hypothetical protein n=1 Tax=Prevotella marseillensis TaxID=2479840 RepID=UPI000F6320A9|nr:hypothetical protein [Prevotella marseillensis]